MRGIAVRWLLVLAACDAPAPEAAKPVAAPPVVAPPVVEPPPVVVAPVVPPVELPLAGVGPGGAEGRAARRQAALDVLTDGASAAKLELIAAPPGRAFDPDLADEMTPTIRVGPRVPGILQKKARVEGPLDRDIVRRIVRAHINELRYCYNQGLARDPNLAGDVTIDFEILDTGRVGESTVGKSTLHDPQIAPCMATAVKRWSFPKPVKLVKVSYPFGLTAG